MHHDVNSLRVELAERSYSIFVGRDILQHVGRWLEERELSRRTFVLTHPKLRELFGPQVAQGLESSGFEPSFIEVPEGEEAKSLDEASRLYEELLERKIERTTALIALGGGVVGDLVGFVAATILRGVPYVQIPTTLLAQVDSSVGGKTAINHPLGKNLIGAFWQPILVVADLATLETLPGEEYLAGMAEVIKYGAIADEEFFGFLEGHAKELLALDTKALKHAVLTSCAIKARVVERDERESGLRSILNFGHTAGHALEALDGYRSLKHGLAVAMGMAFAARLSEALGICPAREARRLIECLESFGLPTRLPPFEAEELWEAMTRDKKVRRQAVRLVLMERIGQVSLYEEVPQEAVLEVLKASGAA